MSNRDPLGYYDALRLTPGANEVEVGLAYRAMKRAYLERRQASIDIGKVQAAYETLMDPKLRAAYETGELDRHGRERTRFRPKLTVYHLYAVLGVVVLAFAMVVATIYGANIRGAFTQYETGDVLIRSGAVRPLGSVVAYDAGHVFPNGITSPAYQVRLEGGNELRWYPASDLERHYRTR